MDHNTVGFSIVAHQFCGMSLMKRIHIQSLMQLTDFQNTGSNYFPIELSLRKCLNTQCLAGGGGERILLLELTILSANSVLYSTRHCCANKLPGVNVCKLLSVERPTCLLCWKPAFPTGGCPD